MKKDYGRKNMKKTIILMLSLVTVIGCMSMPAAAYTKKVWMTARYNNSILEDKAYAQFTAYKWEYVSFLIGLKGKDNKIRGDRKYNVYFKDTIQRASYPVDHYSQNEEFLKIY